MCISNRREANLLYAYFSVCIIIEHSSLVILNLLLSLLQYCADIHISVFTKVSLKVVELFFSVAASSMVVTKRNIYHPFVNKSFAFFVNSKNGSYLGEFFTDVDLSWQPVQDPQIGIPLLVINVFLLLTGGFVHYHIWKMLNREESLVSNILKAYVIVQMILWPLWTSVASATYFIYPLSEVIGSWLCVFSYFLIYSGVSFISFQSTIIAIIRYLFIVHDDRVEKLGKQRTQKMFHWILSLVPIIITIWLYFGAHDQTIDLSPTFNKCTGSYDKVFHLKWSFAERMSTRSARCGIANDDKGPASSSEVIQAVQCGGSIFLFFLLTSNIFDGFLYYRTWTHIIKRYVRFNLFINTTPCVL